MGTCEAGIRLSAETFAFNAVGFSQLETALLRGAEKPNQTGIYPTGFFPEALGVLESAQNYSTPQELAGFCLRALTAAETLREQGQPYRALQIAAAVMSRVDVFATSHYDVFKESAAASWQQCAKGGVRDAWNATVLLGRALRHRPRSSVPVYFVEGVAAVVEQQPSSRPAPALA